MKIYGRYRGEVVDVDDPLKLDRVRARVPEVLGDEIMGWAWPIVLAPGWSWKPVVGDRVFIEFEAGDPDRPLYFGSWYAAPDGQTELPTEAQTNYPTSRVITTPAGHKIEVDDTDGNKTIRVTHADGHKIEIDKDGKITVEGSGDMTLKSTGGKVIVQANSECTIDPKCKIAGGGGNIVTTLHLCAFTGSPHPAGSANAEASM